MLPIGECRVRSHRHTRSVDPSSSFAVSETAAIGRSNERQELDHDAVDRDRIVNGREWLDDRSQTLAMLKVTSGGRALFSRSRVITVYIKTPGRT